MTMNGYCEYTYK